ncbi:MAG: hypothetical protein R8K48_03995 [Gallionella sp.]
MSNAFPRVLKVSIGMTPTRYDDTIVTLISDADKALDRAKQSGCNRVEIYDEAGSVSCIFCCIKPVPNFLL